jgi:hypothetical protein
MSTLDVAGNSNGEVPVYLWKIAHNNPQKINEKHFEWIERLMKIYEGKQ